ncbi:hypothetical protein RUM44_013514 [Polyplax serrata]|uniref:BPL/LPL catalytic domain-containing protein n=1 Tax=Polyplax serrata TaxID=468196 RepID=A0ABR1BEQ0_POLSC
MLLTIFCAAATWMQSRRFGSLRNKINEFASSRTSIVFYKVPEENNDPDEGVTTTATSSSYCKNQEKAVIGDVIHFSTDTRSCVLLAEQIVNVDNWITVNDEMPFLHKANRRKTSLKYPRLFILVEANILSNSNTSNAHCYNINQIGKPRAWRADEMLGLIIESDIDHLTRLSSSFLFSPIIIDCGYEIIRIQTVKVEGRPCLVMKQTNLLKSPSLESRSLSLCADMSSNSGWLSRDLSFETSPTFLRNQMELLRSFSECALQTSRGFSVSIPEDHSSSLIPGNRELKLESPTIMESPTTPTGKIIRATFLESEICSPNGRSNEFRTQKSITAVSTSEINIPRPSREGSLILSTQSTPRHEFQARKSTFSSLYSLGSASTLSIRSVGSGKGKPPNVLIYAESSTTTENIKAVLNETLHKHKYTIYNITETQLLSGVWAANCLLLVICGNVSQRVEPILTTYLIQGGKLLCLCSSFLHSLLPTFRTAEIREREMVHFTYGRWRRVRLMHHVFCYQNSPSRTKFSGDSDETSSEKDRVSPIPQAPSSVEVIDNDGVPHTLHVQVLGVEETWQTPSLLLAYFPSPGGCAVFSQVHLELDPSQGVDEEEEEELKKSAQTQKEILKDILSTHLGVEIGGNTGAVTYTVAYFLGKHETKLKFIEKMKKNLQDGVLKLETVGLKFCKKGETAPPASATLLPVLVHSCPRDFSTLEYFDVSSVDLLGNKVANSWQKCFGLLQNLQTKALGRLLIYAEVLRSSMDIVNGELVHGFAVVPSQQTSGKGRTSNQWLSPPGCAMFSLQLHFPSESYMGRHPSVVQHIVSAAIASALSELGPGYAKAFDLHLKWPNDLYTTGLVKIGGLIVTCSASKSNIICNIGCGINLDNDVPTTCLNRLVNEYNKANNANLKKLSREKLFAIIFTQLEKMLILIEEGNVEYAENIYYKYWLHGGAQVKVLDSSGTVRQVTILGIDEFGFLKVREASGKVFTVHPDGNSFDMMEGLIAPKLK